MIKAILIDDEINCLSSLEILLNTHCPSVKILRKCQSALDSLPLTANGKLKRQLVLERFDTAIEEMYASSTV